MSKIAYFTILSVLMLAAVTVINVHGLNARAEARFVPVSVVARDRADYGVEENVSTIPAISPAIIEDKMHDITPPGSVKLIPYTILPPENSGPAGEDNDNPQTADQTQTKKDHGNNGNGNSGNGNSGNGNSDQSQNQNNGNGKDKDNGSSTNKDNGTDNGNDAVKTNGKGGQASQNK